MGKKIRITGGQFRGLFEESVEVSYDNPLSIDMTVENINEGLIKTYPFDTMMRYVREYFNIPEFYMHSYEKNGIMCVAFDLPKNRSLQERVSKAMNLCGYFKSISMSMDELDRVHYEPKFEEEEREVGDVIYHITHISNINKIRKNGLCPYHKNTMFRYPERIYFFTEDAPAEKLRRAAMALDNYHKNEKDDKRYAILRININRLDDNVRFFKDPNSQYALYTTDNIHPDLISDNYDVINLS